MLLVAFVALFATWIFYEMHWKRRNFPPVRLNKPNHELPGPMPLPIVGNILATLRDPPGFKAYQKWKDQFGSIYTYWLGTIPIVTVNDIDTITEMFVADGESYADRAPIGDFGAEFRGGDYGIIETSGELWRENRRFTLHTLRRFGLGQSRMNEQILHEAGCLLELLEAEALRGPVAIHTHLDRTVASVINLVMFGYRFDEERVHEFHSMREAMNKQTKEFQKPLMMAAMTVPWLRHLPPIKRTFKSIEIYRDIVFDFFKGNIAKRKEIIDFSNDDATDYCEAYLKEIQRQHGKKDSLFFEKQLEVLCLDLWMAGLETTSTSLNWGLLQLLYNPEIISKMHAEFDGVIGSDRLINIQDKPNLQYTCAFIAEVQRWANVVPQNLLRRAGHDVTIGGVTIRKGTAVAPQISMLLYDPQVFPEPEKFDPDRFMDSEGNILQHALFLPFSVGKRACPGEGLARIELFLFFANVVHRFEIIRDDSEPLPSLVRNLENMAKPKPFNCMLRRRIVTPKKC